MTTPLLTEPEARERLVRLIAACGSQKAAAEKAGVSESLVAHVLAGQLPVGRRLGAALGLVAVSVKSFSYLVREDGQ